MRDARSKSSTCVEVPRWEVHEFTLRGLAQAENPFAEGVLLGEFTAPSGKTVTVEGFYDGDDAWRLRLAPDEPGEWRYRLRGEAAQVLQQGRLRCGVGDDPNLVASLRADRRFRKPGLNSESGSRNGRVRDREVARGGDEPVREAAVPGKEFVSPPNNR